MSDILGVPNLKKSEGVNEASLDNSLEDPSPSTRVPSKRSMSSPSKSDPAERYRAEREFPATSLTKDGSASLTSGEFE